MKFTYKFERKGVRKDKCNIWGVNMFYISDNHFKLEFLSYKGCFKKGTVGQPDRGARTIAHHVLYLDSKSLDRWLVLHNMKRNIQY